MWYALAQLASHSGSRVSTDGQTLEALLLQREPLDDLPAALSAGQVSRRLDRRLRRSASVRKG
jgi:hypothetical protein